MVHPTPTKTLLTTTFEPLVMQLSGTLARGARLIERFVQHEPTPERTLDFERELSHLLREVGRRIMAWTLNQLEPQADAVAPCRIEVAGRLYRRRRRSPVTVATLFGSITLWLGAGFTNPFGVGVARFIRWPCAWESKRDWRPRRWPSGSAIGLPIMPKPR